MNKVIKMLKYLKEVFMKLIYLVLILVTQSVFCITLPKSFTQDGKKYVYADFSLATYNITFDTFLKEARVTSIIVLETKESGHVLFDLTQKIDSMDINGIDTSAPLVSLFEENSSIRVTRMRALDHYLEAGSHVMTIKSKISKDVAFKRETASFLTDLSDLTDRNYLERYFPANLAYDQVAMAITIRVTGNGNHKVMTNGKVKKRGKNHWQINYPSFYNSSSIYLHLLVPTSFSFKKTSFKSIDGRNIEIDLYKKRSILSGVNQSLDGIAKTTQDIFNELEADYGPWPHDFFIAYIAGRGGTFQITQSILEPQIGTPIPKELILLVFLITI